MRSSSLIRYLLPTVLTLSISAGVFLFFRGRAHSQPGFQALNGSELNAETPNENPSALSKEILAQALVKVSERQTFPNEVNVPTGEASKPFQSVSLHYSFDPDLQDFAEDMFKSYSPDYGAVVAIDPESGRILSLVGYTHSTQKKIAGNLALRATFPSASVFKVVTAAAAISEKKYSPDTVISFNGANHKLYKKSILQDKITRWTRYMSLREAFAKSVNPVFGKIGAYTVGADRLRKYADRFGFNRKIAADLPVQAGSALFQNDPWSLAEAASGFTRDNTMSPLQGALIAAAIANDGVMMEPYAIESAMAADGSPLYIARKKVLDVSVDPNTAREIRELMHETVSMGTSKKSFKGFFKGEQSTIDVGGKTGTLTGFDPFGKYDWFVGYGIYNHRKIAIAALTISEKYWKVKSSFVARRMIEKYFKGVRTKDRAKEALQERNKSLKKS